MYYIPKNKLYMYVKSQVSPIVNQIQKVKLKKIVATTSVDVINPL